MNNLLATFRLYLRISKVDEIARRYFVMNGFDGALTTLGIILGGYLVGGADAKVILSAGIGAGMAMSISGAWGAYMAERAERMRAIKELEEALFSDLNNSLIDKASKMAIMVVAIVDALAPILTTLISILPFAFVIWGLTSMDVALPVSAILNLVTLFFLGLFLGKISRSNIMIHGIIMMTAGLVTGALVFLLTLGF